MQTCCHLVDFGIVNKLASEFSLKLLDYRPTHNVGTSHTFIYVLCVDDNVVLLDHGNVKSNFHNVHDTINVTIEPFISTPSPRILLIQKI